MAIRDLIPWKKKVPVQVYEPDPVTSMQQRMDRLFDEFWQGFGMAPPSSWSTFSPDLDIVETDKAVEIQAELPGMDRDDIEITLSGRTLTISGEKRQEREQKGASTYYAERSYGSFQRTVTLPENVDAEAPEAEFKRGVLHVSFPKTDRVSKTIAIKAK